MVECLCAPNMRAGIPKKKIRHTSANIILLRKKSISWASRQWIESHLANQAVRSLHGNSRYGDYRRHTATVAKALWSREGE